MTTEISHILTGDASRLVKAYDDLIARQEKQQAKTREATKRNAELRAEAEKQREANRAIAESEKMRNKILAEGAKIMDSLLTPQERFNKQLAEAVELESKGVITTEALQRQTKKLEEELRDATGETKRLAEAERTREAALKKGEQLTRQLETATEKYGRELRELEELHRQGAISQATLTRGRAKLADEFKKPLGNEQLVRTDSLLSSIGTRLTAYAGSLIGIQEGVRLIGEAWQFVKSEQDEALQSIEGTQEANRRLLQISPDAQTFEKFQSLADEASRTAGIPLAEARNLLFDAISTGISPEEYLRIVQSNELIDPAAGITAAGKVRSLFPGEQLTSDEISASILNASQGSFADFERILGALSTASIGIAQLSGGTGLDEATAALAVLTNKFESPEQAAARINALSARAALDERFQGQTLAETVREIAGFSKEDRRDFLGEGIEVTQAFDALSTSLDEIQAIADENRRQRIASRDGGGLVAEKLAIAEGSEEIQALRELRKARVENELKSRERSVEGATAATAIEKIDTKLKDESFFTRLLEQRFGIGEITARLFSSLGASAEDSAERGLNATQAVSEKFPGAFTLNPFSFAGSTLVDFARRSSRGEEAIVSAAPKLENASGRLSTAADSIERSAAQIDATLSRGIEVRLGEEKTGIAPAARAQAAGANR